MLLIAVSLVMAATGIVMAIVVESHLAVVGAGLSIFAGLFVSVATAVRARRSGAA